ncbi:MAG: DUF4416 family protein [Planctomycetota bacterium]|nr:MAG: DUF4416 family protein [Planctomycetota bacterium]
MAQPRKPVPAKLVIAQFSSSWEVLLEAKEKLANTFGPIDLESFPYSFIETDHYALTMGENLIKQFLTFQNLVEQEELKKIKNLTNKWEEEAKHWASTKNLKVSRPLNLDPGLITGAKFILATMKDFSHRLYLGDHVYGEVTLMFQKGRFQIQPWTYPDYQKKETLHFLELARAIYMSQWKRMNCFEDKKRI